MKWKILLLAFVSLFLHSFSNVAMAVESTDATATLTVNFPGLSSVHTDIRVSDNIPESASGTRIASANWKRDQFTLAVPAQVYDLRIRKGGATLIIDNVDCTSGSCTVSDITATMTVNFPGMRSVHTDARVPDGVEGTATGSGVNSKNWQSDLAAFKVLKQVYDVRVRKGSATFVVDNVDCSSGSCSVDGITSTLTVNFPGMRSVHTDANVPDNTEGTANGGKVTHANWKTDLAVMTVFRQVYDVRLRKENATHIVDNVDCTSGSCSVSGVTATMKVNFPGLSGVHTDARIPDGLESAAGGGRVTYSNWKRDAAELVVFPQTYDVRVRKGDGTHIIDNVDCSSGSCTVSDITATMTVNFPGLSSVHTDARTPDGVAGTAEGGKVAHVNWKRDQAVLKLFPGVYDVRVRRGGGTHIIDNVDCSSGSCNISDITATMTVNFPGLSGVHTDARVPDGAEGTATGNKVAHANWKRDQAVLKLFPGVYDVRVRKGDGTHIIDNVDCSSGSCTVSDITATMTVNFPGLSSVHTDARTPDGVDGTAAGGKVAHANWKRNQAVLKLFPGTYDVRLRKGHATHIVDNVDCSSGSCTVDNVTATMTVNFPGMSSVHTDARVTDNVDGTADGNKVTHANWKRDQAILTVFPQTYDVRLRKGKATHIVDNVDCSSGTCSVDNVTATMTVNFPGMRGVHTDARVPDDLEGSAEGGEVTRANWKTDQAVLTVFPQTFDVRLRKGHATHIVDNVDCSSGSCTVADVTATMTVNFPGMRGVHTDVRVPDNEEGSVEGGKIAHANWKTDQAVLTVFPQTYDVRLRKGDAAHIVDNVDCSTGSCTVDNVTATMTVKFPGMHSVHTDARVPDGETGTATGGKVTSLNWQKDQAVLTVFPQLYDLRLSKGSSSHIIDNVDCTSGTCTAENFVSTLTVNFPGLSSVHTSVRVQDDASSAGEGGRVIDVNWKRDQAVTTLFPQSYDLRIRKGAATLIVDNVNCATETRTCVVDDIVATLVAEFPGLTRAHTDVRVPDGVDGVAGGGVINYSNYKSHSAEIKVLRQVVDVRVRHSHATTIFDNVDCTSGTCRVLIEGTTQVTLIDGDRNAPMIGQQLRVFEKFNDGSLRHIVTGVTDGAGRANFTLEGLGAGRVYVLQTRNPFGNGKEYFSPFITRPGPVQFIITVDGENELDLTPPQISFSTPLNNANVSNRGFDVQGTASDDNRVASVTLTVADGINTSLLPALINESAGTWSTRVPASAIITNQVTLTATAIDPAGNQTTTSIVVNPITDNQGPQVSFTSHQPNDDVPVTGFLLSGQVTDLTGVQSLTATLNDPILGDSILNAPVDFSLASGNWTLAVQNGQISENQTVTVSMTAVDVDGNTSTNSISLDVVAVDNSGIHLINRITFGATPELLRDIEANGALAYLDQQLNPAAIDDSAHAARVAGINPASKEELQSWTLLNMTYSKRQLLEVMTWFWDNHFNTDINTTRQNHLGVDVSDTVAYELTENQLFRANALGNFRTLVGISARSPAMLIYLDSISNVADDSNENYTRELLELHTMGVTGGFTHLEIEAGAEIFTGWHLANDAFFFNAPLHNGEAHTFLGQPIAAGGEEQADALMDIVVAHPSTASYICGKLVTVFVNDTPPASLVSRCATQFQATINDDDQIAQVLRLILTSPEFFDAANYRAKIKTPVEFVVGAVRNLGAETNANDLSRAISRMGIDLYEYDVPTGWSEIGEDWINSSLLLERIKWVNQFARQTVGSDTYTDPLVFYPGNGFETADGITGFLLNLTVGDDFTDQSLQQALNLLNGVNGFDLTDIDAEQRLQQLNSVVLSYPQYQYQ